MSIPNNGWKNKVGTGSRHCTPCGSWKDHWIKKTNKPWPTICSNVACANTPTLGAHVIHSAVSGEMIVPMCSSCNGLNGDFSLRGVSLAYAIQC